MATCKRSEDKACRSPEEEETASAPLTALEDDASELAAQQPGKSQSTVEVAEPRWDAGDLADLGEAREFGTVVAASKSATALFTMPATDVRHLGVGDMGVGDILGVGDGTAEESNRPLHSSLDMTSSSINVLIVALIEA